MIFRLTIAVFWMAALVWGQAAPPCMPIDGDRIEARHLAAAVPAFAALAPETPIAIAPMPGVRRIFHELELQALARRHAIALPPGGDLCFEWPLAPIDRAALLDAMQSALAIPEARIEIAETSNYPVPAGRLEFRRESLTSPASPESPSPTLWRGNIVYAENRRFSIWARVVVTAPIARVVAAEPLKRGVPIETSQLRVETGEGFPAKSDLAQTVDEVVGKAPWKDLSAGSAIHFSTLTQPPDVNRGDMIEVEIRSGAARLALTGKAESAGRRGETISVRNLSSNRIFNARIVGKGRAMIQMEPQNAN